MVLGIHLIFEHLDPWGEREETRTARKHRACEASSCLRVGFCFPQCFAHSHIIAPGPGAAMTIRSPRRGATLLFLSLFSVGRTRYCTV